MNRDAVVAVAKRKARLPGLVAGAALLFAVHLPAVTSAQDVTDPVTGFVRTPVHIAAWPGGKKVAVSFALFVEEFGFGQGPNYRPDMVTRNPDLVNEAFRQYAIDWGISRVGRLFKELNAPLTIVLSAEFPGKYASVWKEFRASQPNAPIVAHGMNNTSRQLPLGRGIAEQKAYIRKTLDMIADATGVRPTGWSSPSVYSNGDTMQATAAEGITYTLDQMDSDVIARLKTPDGTLALLPYPVVTVDMGQQLARLKSPTEIESSLAGLRVGARRRSPRRSRAAGDDGGHRDPSLCRRHARRRGCHAARAHASEDGRHGLADRHRRHPQGGRPEVTGRLRAHPPPNWVSWRRVAQRVRRRSRAANTT